MVGRVGIVGAGAWGTALAHVFHRAGRPVTLWSRDPARAAEIASRHQNTRALPGLTLADGIRPTADLGAVAGCQTVVLAVPAQATRQVLEALGPLLRPAIPVISAAKGIERETGLFLSDLVADLLPRSPVAVLSGPGFAADVVAGLPTAVTLACADPIIAAGLAQSLASPGFRIYHSTDVRGVEIGGAAKNVLAIAAGVVIGRGLGESARAALVTRGFAELRRFGEAHGGRAETLMGLSGLGDLILTASSQHSRNFALGLRIGGGIAVEDALSSGSLAEGAATASILVGLARARAVEMPIAAMVDAVLQGWVTVDGALEALINRPQKAE